MCLPWYISQFRNWYSMVQPPSLTLECTLASGINLFSMVVSPAGSTVDVSTQSRNCTRLPVTSSLQVSWGWLSKFPVPPAAGSGKENISGLPEQRRWWCVCESYAARGKRCAFTTREESHRTLRLSPVYLAFIKIWKFQAKYVSVTSMLYSWVVMLVNIVSYDVCDFIFQWKLSYPGKCTAISRSQLLWKPEVNFKPYMRLICAPHIYRTNFVKVLGHTNGPFQWYFPSTILMCFLFPHIMYPVLLIPFNAITTV